VTARAIVEEIDEDRVKGPARVKQVIYSLEKKGAWPYTPLKLERGRVAYKPIDSLKPLESIEFFESEESQTVELDHELSVLTSVYSLVMTLTLAQRRRVIAYLRERNEEETHELAQ